MPFNFEYIGHKKDGEQAQGSIVALDSDDAIKKLKESGIKVDRIFIKFVNKKIVPVAEEVQEKTETTEKKQVDFSQILKNKYLLSVPVVLIIIVVIVLMVRGGGALDINHRIVKTEDLSEGQGAIKTFFVVIANGTTKKEVKKLTRYLFKSERKKDSHLLAANFCFFYPDQKLRERQAVATVKYNWQGFASWDESYSLEEEKK